MRATLLLAATLSIGVPATWAFQTTDTKSPDLQQQKHPENTPPPAANAPTSTDTDTTRKPTPRKRHKVRQAKGTPQPQPTESTDTH